MKEYSGKYNGEGMRIGIVTARFNETITRSLLNAAVETLVRHGVDQKNITVAWVPGAFEAPLIARQMAFSENFDAVIALGAVIRGATPHFDYVAGQAAAGIAQASLDSGIPVIFGILTTDTIEQALERAGTKNGNKGHDSAQTAIEMCSLLRQLSKN